MMRILRILFFIALLALLSFSLIPGCSGYKETQEEIEICIKEKQIKPFGDGDSKYMVYADGEVFECVDDPFSGKYNSSDVYNSLDVNSCYWVSVIGWRKQKLSMYRNILFVVEKSSKKLTK